MKLESFLICDIGNTTTDFFYHKKTQDFYLKINNQIFNDIKNADTLNSIISKEDTIIKDIFSCQDIFISSVNDLTLNIIKDIFKKSNISIIDRKLMKNYCQTNNYKIDNIDILGSDLFADIVAIKDKINQIIVDCGTASKILYLDEERNFYGGIIYPGVNLCNAMLSKNTYLLDNYNFKFPNNLISLKTDEAVLSGAINGTYHMTKGLINRLIKEKNITNYKVFLTGGNSKILNEVGIKLGEQDNYIYNNYVTLQGIINSFDLDFIIKSDKVLKVFLKYKNEREN